jgi:hypothetical protein
MLGLAEKFRNAQTAQGKEQYSILHNYESGWRKGFTRAIGLGVLRSVSAGDKLYVMSHGSEVGSRFTGASRGATMQANGEWEGGALKKYSPAQLAEVIQKEGLTTAFVRLHLFICGSGLKPRQEGAKPFAQALAIALGDLGYKHIRVLGYVAFRVSPDNNQISGLMHTPGGDFYRPLNESMVAYGPTGGQVPIPALMDAGV